jgi:hypothetical protein
VHVIAWLTFTGLAASCGGRSAEVLNESKPGGTGGGAVAAGGSHAGKGGNQATAGSGARLGAGAAGLGGGGFGGTSTFAGGGSLSRGGGESTAGGRAVSGAGGMRPIGDGGRGFGGGAGSTNSAGTGGSSAQSGSGGTLGEAGESNGGAAGAAGAPPAGVPAAGLSLTLSQPDASLANGRSCTAGSTGQFTYVIGSTMLDHAIADGEDGVHVACEVAFQAGLSYATQGAVSGTDRNSKEAIAFTFSSTIADEYPPSATATFSAPETGELTDPSSPSCTLDPVTTLDSGVLVADIDCPLLASTSDATNGCHLHGTIAFESCVTK